MKVSSADQHNALAFLRDLFPRDAAVYTLTRHTTRSGVRSVAVIGDSANIGITDAAWAVAKLGIGRFDRTNGGTRYDVTGMDAGAAIVHDLSIMLYGSHDALTHRRI